MANYTLKQAFLNHTNPEMMSAKDLLWHNTRQNIPAHPRHKNPRWYAKDHARVVTRMEMLVQEPTLRTYNDLFEVLENRTSSRCIARRIAARTALRIKDTPFVLAYSIRAREYSVALKRDTMKYKGRLVLKGELSYDFVRGEYVNTLDGRWSIARIVVLNYVKSEDGTDIDPLSSGRGFFCYAGYCTRGNLPETDLVIRGVTYTRVTDFDGNISFIHPEATINNEIMSRFDVTFALEAINGLMQRNATRLLRGQPNRDSSLPSIGVELELDNITNGDSKVRGITDSIRSGLKWRGCVTAVNDGSLGSYGAEFVTGWGDPELVMQSLESTLTAFDLRNPKYATDRCGVHIHLSRSFFASAEHIAAVQWVFERAMFRPVVEHVARRYSTQYCQAGRSGRRYNTPQNGKYRAVNCDHLPSIEFRMFSAPKNEGDMLHYKDLVLSVVEWARGIPRLWTPRAFGRWLAAQDGYSRLFRHLEPVFLKLEPMVEAVGEEIEVQAGDANDVANIPVPTPRFSDSAAVLAAYVDLEILPFTATPPRPAVSFAELARISNPVSSDLADALVHALHNSVGEVVSDPTFASNEN